MILYELTIVHSQLTLIVSNLKGGRKALEISSFIQKVAVSESRLAVEVQSVRNNGEVQ